jgi:hypothetical protein
VIEVSSFKGPNTVGVSFLSPEDWNRSSFRNDVFSSDLEFRTIDKVHKHSDSELSDQLHNQVFSAGDYLRSKIGEYGVHLQTGVFDFYLPETRKKKKVS